MRLTFCAFGLELDVTLGPETADEDAADQGAALNGGTLASEATAVTISATDQFMGFTNGREGCADPDDGRLR